LGGRGPAEQTLLKDRDLMECWGLESVTSDYLGLRKADGAKASIKRQVLPSRLQKGNLSFMEILSRIVLPQVRRGGKREI